MIEELSRQFADHFVLVLLVLTRLSAMLISLPAFGVGIPRRVRAVLAVLLTALIVPAVAKSTSPESLPAIEQPIDLAIALAREALIGLLIGSVVQLLITGMQLGGEAITSSSGMQLGDAEDPTNSASMPAIARLVGLLVTAVMLIAGGHRILIGVLIESFDGLPAGQVIFTDSMMTLLVDQLTAGMAAGIRVAAPVMAALLLCNLVTGLVSRTLPQINVLAIGLSINALALLFVTAVTIGSAGLIFEDELSRAIGQLVSLW